MHNNIFFYGLSIALALAVVWRIIKINNIYIVHTQNVHTTYIHSISFSKLHGIHHLEAHSTQTTLIKVKGTH